MRAFLPISTKKNLNIAEEVTGICKPYSIFIPFHFCKLSKPKKKKKKKSLTIITSWLLDNKRSCVWHINCGAKLSTVVLCDVSDLILWVRTQILLDMDLDASPLTTWKFLTLFFCATYLRSSDECVYVSECLSAVCMSVGVTPRVKLVQWFRADGVPSWWAGNTGWFSDGLWRGRTLAAASK